MFDKGQIQQIQQIVQKAGSMLAEFFQDPKYRQPETKGDGSPVTLADKTVSDFLVQELEVFGFPVVSEEGDHMEDLTSPYFIVDPLDGTKYFARGEPDFAVLLGFVENQIPTFGCISSPLSKNLYHAISGEGAYKNDQLIKNPGPGESIVAFSSGFHKRPAREWICKELGIGEILIRGSALKFCDLALGKADFFPRFGPTSEWDTAGAQVLLQEADCILIDVRDAKPLTYGKPKRLNKGFIACHKSLLPKVINLLEKHVWPKMEDKK